ncbi:ribonuclease III domain-containing protein [Methanolobus sp.]|uniref:ribonuclease III family protein n=1 Tax=Methanolobus sp. TaxID=1874737 RepID=UPI0025E264D9|nr:ribonuclease III domain-containing protein [Methanolobus sp.]
MNSATTRLTCIEDKIIYRYENIDLFTSSDQFKGNMCCFPVKFNGKEGKKTSKLKNAKLIKLCISFDTIHKNRVSFLIYDTNDEEVASDTFFNENVYIGLLKNVDNITLLGLIHEVSHRFPVDILYEEILVNNPELVEIENIIGVEFRDKKTLQSSLIHHTFTKEHPFFIECLNLVDIDNQRLEHLGDSALGSVISKYAYENYFSFDAGDLTKFKAFLVENNNISKIADKLNLDNYLLKGKGESKTNSGRKKRLADVFEAIVGAIFYDQGYDKAEEVVLKHYSEDIQEFLSSSPDELKAIIEKQDASSEFNLKYHQLHRKSPKYEYEELSINPPYYSCTIVGNGIPVIGFGKSKKLAKNDFSEKGLEFLE